MEERADMFKTGPTAVILGGAFAVVAMLAMSSMAQASSPVETSLSPGHGAFSHDVEVSSQARSRPPTQLRVTPRRYRYEGNSPYPRATNFGYPGPGAYRECVARYVQEYRPSGTVIVPRMNCWWVGG